MATQTNLLQCPDRKLDVSENDGSSFIIISNPNDLPTTISQNITLLQEPSESMEFKLVVRVDYYGRYSFDFDITFANYIHEISQDYGYILQIQSLKKERNNRRIHVNLFSYEEMRSTNNMSLKNVSISTKVESKDVIHYCCCIRRFNCVKSTIRHVSFSQDIGTKMLKDGIYSDVTLIVGEKNFKVHKHILSLQSDVFKAMFSHNMAENESGIVKIDDFDVQVIEDMLQYIYTCTTQNLPKLAQELFKAAHKYEIHGLKSKCEEYLIFNLNHQNVIDILDLARIYDLKSLKKGASSFVHNRQDRMVKEESYRKFLCRDLSVSTVTSILLLCDEYDLEDVKREAFKFVNDNNKSLVQNEEFLDLFDSETDLMRELYVYTHS